MLELQSIQKEQQRRELLLRIQKDVETPMETTVPLRKAIRSGTNQTDNLQHNNNRDTLHFDDDDDGNDDDIATTVADDIIVMKTEAITESSRNSTRNGAENGTGSATITVCIRQWPFKLFGRKILILCFNYFHYHSHKAL